MKYLAAVLFTGLIASPALAAGPSGSEPTTIVTPPPATTSASARAFPSVFGVPSAVAPPPNSGFVGVTFANPRSGIEGEGSDGDLFAGYTIGNPVDNVALTFGINITSLDDDFGDSGSLFLSGSRLIGASASSLTFVGVSVTDIATWGDIADFEPGGSIQISHIRDVGASAIPVQITAGYATANTYDADLSGDLEDGAFLGFGVGLTQTLSASVSFTETQMNIGATAALPGLNGLSVTAGVYDVTDEVERQQYSLSLTYSF